eukprot:15449815-Alexandrium_andersonii.AAC.1
MNVPRDASPDGPTGTTAPSTLKLEPPSLFSSRKGLRSCSRLNPRVGVRTPACRSLGANQASL